MHDKKLDKNRKFNGFYLHLVYSDFLKLKKVPFEMLTFTLNIAI